MNAATGTGNARAKAKAAAPRSNVDAVIDRLHPTIQASLFGPSYKHDPNAIRRRASLVADANESLRLLRARRANLGPRDNAGGVLRAALVVDYLCRNAPTATNDILSPNDRATTYRRAMLPATVLALAGGMSNSTKDRRAMEVMQTVLSSHLDGSSVGERLRGHRRGDLDGDDVDGGRRTTRGKRDAPTSAVETSTTAGAATSSRTAPATSTHRPTDLIRDLCIRLGPMISDAEVVASCAIGTFRRLASGAHVVGRTNDDDRDDDDDDHEDDGGGASSSAKRRRRFSAYELRMDVERHRSYYEAACFYLAVKWSEGDNARDLVRGRRRADRADRKDGEMATGECADGRTDEDGRGGGNEEEDDDDADDERHLTEADVISEANLLGGTFRDVLACVRETTTGMSISTMAAIGDGFGSDVVGGGGSSTLFEVAGGSVDAPPAGGTYTPPDSAFEQWKRRVLLEAKTTEAMKVTGRRDDGKDWLEHAADEVLRKAGLVHFIHRRK
jgi:hypothetical protein